MAAKYARTSAGGAESSRVVGVECDAVSIVMVKVSACYVRQFM